MCCTKSGLKCQDRNVEKESKTFENVVEKAGSWGYSNNT